MKRLIYCQFRILLLSLLFCFSAKSQSLKDTLIIKEKLMYARKARTQNLDSSLVRAKEALVISESLKLKKWEAKCLAIIGGILSLKMNEKDIIKSNEYTFEAYEIFRSFKDSLRMKNCLNNISNNYIMLHNYPEALKYSYKTLKILKGSSKKINQKRSLAFTYGTLGRIYGAIKLEDSSLINYKRAKRLFKEVKAPEEAIITLNVAGIYQYKGDLINSKKYYQEACDISKKGKFITTYYQASNGLAVILLKEQKYDQAKDILSNTLGASNNYYPDIKSKSYYLLAKVYDYLNQKDSTQYFVQKALKISDATTKVNIQIDILQFQKELLERDNQYQKADQVQFKILTILDSIRNLQNAAEVSKILIGDQGEKNKKQIKTYQSKNRKQWIGISILLILGAILVIVYFLQKSKSIKLKATKQELNNKYKLVTEEKDSVSKKLVSITANLALQNELLNETNILLKQIQIKIDDKFLDNELTLTQNKIKYQLQIEKGWKEFFYHFDEVNKSFIENLKQNYDLTTKDLKMCAFVKIGLSNKEIARLINVNPQSVSVSLYRLKIKMKLPENISASEYIKNHL